MKPGIQIDDLQHVAVLGAAGKMGSGIALLILQLFAQEIAKGNKNEQKNYRLTLIDANQTGFVTLRKYLKDQLKKYAERNINELRKYYQNRNDLIDNADMIETFSEEAMECVVYSTLFEECCSAQLVFEAILEDITIKSEVFKKLNKLIGHDCYYFSNTSSIPIHVLQEKSDLEGRLIGFHFYNPPAVQRLVELVVPENTPEGLKTLSETLAKRLNKTVVYSSDVAGFIGNGHFIREVHFACEQVNMLSQNLPLHEAIVLVNRITQEFLLRPMGIFQLIDYVGIEVVQRIAKIMTTYLHINLENKIIDDMVQEKVWGGQYGDGLQKDGFFHYEKGIPVSVYDFTKKKYILLSEKTLLDGIGAWIGGKPPLGYTWKMLAKDLNKDQKKIEYFTELSRAEFSGAKLANQFVNESEKISTQLVTEGIAKSQKDVDIVLKNGFLHL